jgi:hypothetical protein
MCVTRSIALVLVAVAAASAAAAAQAGTRLPAGAPRPVATRVGVGPVPAVPKSQARRAPRPEGPRLKRVPRHAPEEVEPSNEAATSASTSTAMTWRGGRVQDYTKTFVIFWLPVGYTFERYGSSAQFEGLVDGYFADIGGSTFANTQTQYYDATNWVTNSSTLTAAVVDTSPYPVHGGYVYTTDADIRAEVVKTIKAQGWPYGLHEQFFVFTAANVLTWDSWLGWSNKGSTSYCAYHNYFSAAAYGLGDFPIVYANMPGQDGHYGCYAKTFAGYDAAGQALYRWYAPNGDYTADSAISTTSHEQFEMITDPELDAWKDENGAENGDKCSYIYGAVGSDTGNVTLNGNRYILQGEWSNALFDSGVFGCAWYRAVPYN